MTQEQQPSTPLAAPIWREEAEAWIHAAVERLGLRTTGSMVEPHASPWSTVLRVPTTAGDLWFKAPNARREAALTSALIRYTPTCVLPLLAVDIERGWMLMPDGGTRLRELVRGDRDFRDWLPVLPVYAELQITLAAHVDELLGLGVPDYRLAALPAQLPRLLQDTEILRIDREPGLTAAEHAQLWELVPRVEELAAELAAYGIPETLNHGDLHDGNVFAGTDGPRFFDWGDATVSHPFYSLRTTFVSVEISLDLPDGAGELPELRDAYLEPWTRLHPREELAAAFGLARKLAPLDAAVRWYEEVVRMDAEQREEYALPVPALLQELLDHVMR